MESITVQELEIASRAAERWPVGVNGGQYLSDQKLDQEFREREWIEVGRAIGCGCPATEIAAHRAQQRGEEIVSEREAEETTAQILSMFYGVSRPLNSSGYLDLLTDNPSELARQFRMLAEAQR